MLSIDFLLDCAEAYVVQRCEFCEKFELDDDFLYWDKKLGEIREVKDDMPCAVENVLEW